MATPAAPPTAGHDPAGCKVVLAGTVAKTLLAEIQAGLSMLDKPPHLVGFLANDDPGAKMYADWTAKTCLENGFHFTLRTTDRESLEETLLAANADPSIDGIIVYYPIFNNGQDQYLQSIISVGKDVEGLCFTYKFNMYHNKRYLDSARQQKSILPCTPLAMVKILEHVHVYNPILPYGNRLFGHTVTIINRSEVVGRPLAALLANDGARVYSVDRDRDTGRDSVKEFSRGEGIQMTRHEAVDKDGWELKDTLPLSDVVISGVPGSEYRVPVELLREGAVCINFSSEKNFPPEVKRKASIYVPAIGKVTIVVLLRNLLRIVHNSKMSAAAQGSGAVKAP